MVDSSYKHKFKKKYGQNFISDKNLLNKIAESANIDSNDVIIEIGTGTGNLTEAILNKKPKQVITYEIDSELEDLIDQRFDKRVIAINDDFLKRDISEDIESYRSVKMIANLPYYITTPIIMKVVDEFLNIEEMIIMVQKEVGERFMATPKNKEYGAISVILQAFFKINKVMDVSRKIFVPVPNVDSVVISLKKLKNPEIKDIIIFKKFVKQAFSQKRKLLKNNINQLDWEKLVNILIDRGYNENVRAEEIGVEDFIFMSNFIISK